MGLRLSEIKGCITIHRAGWGGIYLEQNRLTSLILAQGFNRERVALLFKYGASKIATITMGLFTGLHLVDSNRMERRTSRIPPTWQRNGLWRNWIITSQHNIHMS